MCVKSLPQFSVQFSRSVVFDSLRPRGLQHARFPCPSPTPGVLPTHVHWVSDTIHPSHPLLSLLLLPSIFPSIRVFASESALASGSQRIGASAPASALPVNFQGWFPLWWTGLISLLSKGLSRVFSSTTVQKYQFLCTQLYLRSNSQILTWLLEKP